MTIPPPLRPWLRAAAAFAIAVAVWLPSLRFFFQPARADLAASAAAPRARALLARQLHYWRDGEARRSEREAMRATNPEWDFMGRTFVVMALGDAVLEERDARDRAEMIATMDRIIEDTLAAERAHGMHHFLLDYSRRAPFRHPEGRSLFVDGEIAMMLAVRQLVAPAERWRDPLAERVAIVERELERSPLLFAESYPDEGWTFCNTTALAALRISDRSTGQDHRDLAARWVRSARTHLIDRDTGMLVSSFGWNGEHRDGPEGSSIYWAAAMLRFVDDGFARDQYERARTHLDRSLLGFGWSREWPSSGLAALRSDVDSGPIVPLVEASPGSSGMSLVGAAAFGDPQRVGELLASLDLAAFPIEDERGLRYAASNQVGDAALLYALGFGPTLRQVNR